MSWAFTKPELIQSARKTHLCFWCGQLVNVGESYTRYRAFYSGDASTMRMHNECHLAMTEAATLEGDVIEFGLADNPRGGNCGYCGDENCVPCGKHAAYRESRKQERQSLA